VLVVEDEALLRWAITESLAASGHSVVAVGDAASALRALEGAPSPDAILLDYRLPDSNDLGLLRTLRERAPRSAVVLMTACGSPELTEAALALGVFRVVDKPFEMVAIEACLVAARAAAPPVAASEEKFAAEP
jgi:CheY-like chemotaxis protein